MNDNAHPYARALWLQHIRHMRTMMRHQGRHAPDCRRILKDAQRALLRIRAARGISAAAAP